MQSFSFKSDFDENQNIERIINERNRKLAKQQIVFAIILFIVAVLLIWYIIKKIMYTEFDGYVQTEYIDYRAMEDLYLFRQYKDVGDIVFPGDTLYSYMYMNVIGISNMNAEPSYLVNERNLRMQLHSAYADVNVLRVEIRELEKQIAKEENNIRFGLTDNSHKMDLERELAETRARLDASLTKANMYYNLLHETLASSPYLGKYSSDFQHEQTDLDYSLKKLYENQASAIRYAIVQDTAIVTKLWAPSFSRVFKKEQITQLEVLSLMHSNMQVVAYVPTGDMSRVNNHTKAQIIVNDDVSFTATVQLLGARTEELPEELRNSLSHTYTTVMVVFKPDFNQELPLWAVVDHVPVKIRINNFDNGRRRDGSDYWFIDRNGLTEETQWHLGLLDEKPQSVIEKEAQNENNRRYAKAANDTTRHATAEPESVAAEPDMAEAADTAETGETLLPETVLPADTVPAQVQTKPVAEAAPQPAYIRHKIEKGESFFSIAQKYNTTTGKIQALNPKVNPKKLYVGTVLRIPAEN